MHVEVIVVSEALDDVEKILREKIDNFLKERPLLNPENFKVFQSEACFSGTGKTVTVTIFY